MFETAAIYKLVDLSSGSREQLNILHMYAYSCMLFTSMLWEEVSRVGIFCKNIDPGRAFIVHIKPNNWFIPDPLILDHVAT